MPRLSASHKLNARAAHAEVPGERFSGGPIRPAIKGRLIDVHMQRAGLVLRYARLFRAGVNRHRYALSQEESPL
ncbi:MAG: hypothetical protein WD696_02190 [Bryobacteraceae bacterium]